MSGSSAPFPSVREGKIPVPLWLFISYKQTEGERIAIVCDGIMISPEIRIALRAMRPALALGFRLRLRLRSRWDELDRT